MSTTTFRNNIEFAPFNSVNRDRAINADHLARWLSSVNGNGVTRKFNEFDISYSGGMNVTINTGIGFVEGHHLYLKSSQTITIADNTSLGSRIDTIGFRLDIKEREVTLYYTTGVNGTEIAPTPTTDNVNYYEIPMYNITVPQGASTISATNVQDVRQYVVSTATYFKKYTQLHSVITPINSIVITTPFNATSDDVEILVNGIPLLTSQFRVENKTIIFGTTINAGNDIQVNIWHFMDGSGSIDSWENVLTEYNKVHNISKYYYICTGQNDNIAISRRVQEFLADTSIDANSQIEIMVCGKCGVSTYYDTTPTSPQVYNYFHIGTDGTTAKTVYLNFANCPKIEIACPTTNSQCTIFAGSDINIRNVSLNVTSGYNVDIFNGKNVHCVDSEFWMTTTNNCTVAKNYGTFENIRTSITSSTGNAYCFYGNGGLTRIIGGTHFAHANSTSKEAVCFYVAADQTENVLHVTMANCPKPRTSIDETTAESTRKIRPIKVNSGYATFTQNTLWMRATNANLSFYSSDAEKCYASGNAIISKN